MMDPERTRFGLPVQQQAPQNTMETNLLGRRKTFAGLQLFEWTFVGVSMVNILICLGLTIYRLAYSLHNDPDFKTQPDFTFALLIIVNSAFCAVYVINGVLREREFELYALTAAILLILLYCIMEFSINTAGHTTIKLARLIIALVLAPPNIFLCIYVARHFGWLEFRIVGASEAFQLMYRDTSRFSSLLKFNLQLTVSLVILVLLNGTNVSVEEKVVLGVGIPLAVFLSLLGWMSIRYERRWLVIVFLILSAAVPVYIIYKLYQSFDLLTSHKPGTENKDKNLILYIIIAAGFIGLLLQVVIVVETLRCLRNFGRGLKERAFEAETNERTSLLSNPRR